MNNTRGAILGCGGGFTVLFWIVVIAAYRAVDRVPATAKQQTPAMSSQTPNINISSNAQTGGFTGINDRGTVNLGPAPRVISPEKQTELSRNLHVHSPGEVTFVLETSSSDSQSFARSIAAALTEAGISVRPESEWGMTGGISTTWPNTGIDVGKASFNSDEKLADEIIAAFCGVGIEAHPSDPIGRTGLTTIRVRRQPQP